jgi:hypothetical protein
MSDSQVTAFHSNPMEVSEKTSKVQTHKRDLETRTSRERDISLKNDVSAGAGNAPPAPIPFMDRVWVRFTPALVIWPLWLFIVASGDSQNSFAAVFQYWPASVAMVLGSFIAGSTPLGGGIVAFPVSVLVLQFTSSESRDASVLVQTIVRSIQKVHDWVLFLV